MEAQKQNKKNFYQADEQLGALFVIASSRKVLSYLKEHGWSDWKVIEAALGNKNVMLLLCDLKDYGLVKSELRDVGLGETRAFYALADDFDKRIAELSQASNTSIEKYYKRHNKGILTDMTDTPTREYIENFLHAIRRGVREQQIHKV